MIFREIMSQIKIIYRHAVKLCSLGAHAGVRGKHSQCVKTILQRPVVIVFDGQLANSVKRGKQIAYLLLFHADRGKEKDIHNVLLAYLLEIFGKLLIDVFFLF